MWGWISLHSVGELAHIEGRFTAAKYIEMLEECYLPSLRDSPYSFSGQIVFIHDKCPIHTARIVQQWFMEQPNLELLDWPSKGCDMNPIENVWANRVNCWDAAHERTSEQHTQAQWEMFRVNLRLVNSIVSNMSERLQAVIEKGGGWSGY